MPSKNFQTFLKTDLSKAKPGQYLVLVGGKLFKKGKNIKKMLSEARKKFPSQTPFVTKVPERGVLVV